MNYQNKVVELEQQQSGLAEQISFAKTMEQREKVLTLEKQMKDERARTAELKLKSAETDVFVSERVKELETEIRELKAKAFKDFHAMLSSDDHFKALNREVNALEKEINALV
jgi:predicted  nucleic acid-binding Zn-ribbon protein